MPEQVAKRKRNFFDSLVNLDGLELAETEERQNIWEP
jgi:hypothetical protein